MTRNQEALKIAEEVLLVIQKNKPLSVTQLLRQCARIAELLDLNDILWINNELKGYPDDDVPPYRLIEVNCRHSWIGKLLPRILEIRKRRDLFYYKWKKRIPIRESSVMLESWTKHTHSIDLGRKTILGMDVTEVADVLPEQTWEILHRIADKVREFVSRIDIKLAELKVPCKKNKKKITAYLSASFSDKIDSLISWFISMIEALDIEVIWLKKKYQARPPEEKMKENIQLCNCFIQIITSDVYEEGKEAGWIGNEIAWAKDSTPNGNIAVFVEKGVKATGLARTVADNLSFDPENLSPDAPKITQYLNDLKKRVLLNE